MIKTSQTHCDHVFIEIPASECERSKAGVWALYVPEKGWIVHWDNVHPHNVNLYPSHNSVLTVSLQYTASRNLQKLIKAYVESQEEDGR